MINNILKMTQSFNGYNTGIISPTNAEMKKYGFNTGISFGKAILFNFLRPVRDYTLNEFKINNYQINADHLKQLKSLGENFVSYHVFARFSNHEEIYARGSLKRLLFADSFQIPDGTTKISIQESDSKSEYSAISDIDNDSPITLFNWEQIVYLIKTCHAGMLIDPDRFTPIQVRRSTDLLSDERPAYMNELGERKIHTQKVYEDYIGNLKIASESSVMMVLTDN